jgi:Leucine-rich repeat (LRR) protein
MRAWFGFLVPALLLGAGLEWIASLGGQVQRDPAGQITAVTLRASWVTDGDLLELARLASLQRLDLSRTRITDQGLSYLKKVSTLREVDLSYAEKIGDPAHAIIKEWKQLTRLNLRGTVIADETAAAAATLPNLEVLDIADTIVGDPGVEALSLAPKLKVLSMGSIRMGELGYQSLRQFTGLEQLDLSGNRPLSAARISARGLEAIASLKQLRVLRLGHLRFPAKSFPVLKALENLERLGLEFCTEVNDDALPHLAAWKSLRVVDLSGTKVTAAGVASLREQRPDCKILFSDPL